MAIVLYSEKGSALTKVEHDNNFDELNKIPNGKIFPKDSGVGILIDSDAPDWGWYDLIGELKVYGDVGDATRVMYRGGIKALQFDENDSAYVDLHIPHDYAPNTPIYIHVHWSHTSTECTGGSCTWGFEAMYAKGHNQAAFEAPVNISVIQSGSTTQYQHLIAETIASDVGGSAVTLDTGDLEVDGIIQCRVYLDSNDLTTSGAPVVPFAHFVDIHYQSTGLATKNKSPDFWT